MDLHLLNISSLHSTIEPIKLMHFACICSSVVKMNLWKQCSEAWFYFSGVLACSGSLAVSVKKRTKSR